ncbi:MAG: (2Fe-2S) ferredoxin domain-containing protein [Clostridiales bacterium]|jgi:NADP-reducing hydrogenase subunit HndB|nr:(2Fe-2S) ferredoxin domain-containing protein [Clostridiales bacterium]
MKSIAELQEIRNKAKQQVELRKEHSGYRVIVGMATCGIAAGARPVMTAFLEEVQGQNLGNVTITQTGCIGLCRLEPIVEVFEPDGDKVTYVKMTAEKAKEIVEKHLKNNKPVLEYAIGNTEDK